METFFDKKAANRMGRVLLVLALFAALFVAMKFVNEMKKFTGGNGDVSQVSTIDVSGTGTAFAIPDVASESFTVEEKAATVHDAQTTVTTKVNKAVAFLKTSGIAEKDIQTTNYSANPEYSYPTPCSGKVCAMTSTAPKIVGYSVSETITVKVRDTTKVGAVVDGLGALGVTGLSGPDFGVDNPDMVTAQARAKAIADAEMKAKILARDLGVTLVRVVRFNENNGGGYAVPMMYNKAMDMATNQSVGAAAPEMPAGQNKYVSNVTVTYEIQ